MPIVFEVARGTSAQKVAKQLHTQNLAPSHLITQIVMRAFKYDKSLRAGEYLLEPKMSLAQILQKLTTGKVIMHRLTLAEGLTSKQMLALIEDNKFLSGKITQTVTEGDLLPETYTFAKGETRDAIVNQAKKAMTSTLDKIWSSRQKDLPLKNAYELLILASIIEKETGINAERGMVSSVFINRLNQNMLLQTDPTVIYAITLGQKEFDRTLRRKDLEIDSPYNTYRYQGLPPTPICNPGKEALQAAAHPSVTPYFYFVADGKGGHRFAKTLAEHQHNIKLWLNQSKSN